MISIELIRFDEKNAYLLLRLDWPRHYISSS